MGRQPRSKATWIIVLCIVIIGGLYLNFIKINQLETQMMNLQYQLNNVAVDTNTAIQDGFSSLDYNLNKKDSIVSSQDLQINSFNGKTKTVNITLKATPKNFTVGTQVLFSYKVDGGKEQTVVGKKGNGLEFTADLDVPVCNELEYGIILETKDKKQVESLGFNNEIRDRYTLHLTIYPMGDELSFSRGKVTQKGGAEVTVDKKGSENQWLTSLKMDLKKNGKNLFSKDMLKETNGANPSTSNFKIKFSDVKYEINSGDVVELVVTGADNRGFTYKSVVSRWTVDSKRDIKPDVFNGAADVEVK